jgi:pre-mRNA-processing factor 17
VEPSRRKVSIFLVKFRDIVIDIIPCVAKSTFHGSEEKDYLGRSWTQVPSGLRVPPHANIQPSANPHLAEHDAYIPKKCIHKYLGHAKGVQAIELFPYSGHLLLSASMDGKCMIWDTMRERNLLRTYMGHTEAVRSINMTNDGSKFLSSGYDRYVRLWDVETGAAVATFSNRKMHYQGEHTSVNMFFVFAHCNACVSEISSNQ